MTAKGGWKEGIHLRFDSCSANTPLRTVPLVRHSWPAEHARQALYPCSRHRRLAPTVPRAQTAYCAPRPCICEKKRQKTASTLSACQPSHLSTHRYCLPASLIFSTNALVAHTVLAIENQRQRLLDERAAAEKKGKFKRRMSLWRNAASSTHCARAPLTTRVAMQAAAAKKFATPCLSSLFPTYFATDIK